MMSEIGGSSNRYLPKKEGDLFKNVVKHYESKQYKKGLKNADAILKRFPNHGETLCMKGLIVNSLGKKDEAHELVKKGLMMDMRSHVCWHVYGLLYRSDRNYNEAIKAYKQALKIDCENLQILRDMSLLQIQMRDLPGFLQTRLRILTLRPNSKVHWLTYAFAVHACGDALGCVSVLDTYLGTLGDAGDDKHRGLEASELHLYKNKLLSQTKSDLADGLDGIRDALRHLDHIHHLVVDRTGWLESKLSYELSLAMFQQARSTCFQLFHRGSTEDHQVQSAYMCALLGCDRQTSLQVTQLAGTNTLATWRPLTHHERQILIKEYATTLPNNHDNHENGTADKTDEVKTNHDNDAVENKTLAMQFPKSPTIKRIYLTLLPTDSQEFHTEIDRYCRRQLIKGVPSLGSDLSSLYLIPRQLQCQSRYVLATDPVDIRPHPVYQLLVQLVDSYIASLSSQNTFPEDTADQPPSTLLWTWYLRSILHEQVADYSSALIFADKCIQHTPTGVDFYELKSRLLEQGGDLQSAADVVDAGRDLDHQDRYINNQATKALLRAGREDQARQRIALFTRHEGNAEQNLYDMQCTWYELELADMWMKKGNFGRSLKKYMAVVKHYEDFHEDQFDFHAYCIRKVTLRTYSQLLQFEDSIWGRPTYAKAAEQIIRIYLHLWDHPTPTSAPPDYSKMTPAERKKAKNIARKKKKAIEKERPKDALPSPQEDNSKKKKKHVVEEDPDGKEWLNLKPDQEANKFCKILITHNSNSITSWALQYDVSIRRKKMLMALQALFKMKSIDAQSHQLFARIVDFAQKHKTISSSMVAQQVIDQEFPTLMNGQSLSDFVRSTMQQSSDTISDQTSLPMRVAIARALVDISPSSSSSSSSKSEAVSYLMNHKLEGRCVTIETCRDALQFMDSLGYKEQFMTMVKEKFPFVKDLN